MPSLMTIFYTTRSHFHRHKSAIDDAAAWMRECITAFGAPKSANAASIAAYLNAHLIDDQTPPTSPRTARDGGGGDGSATARSFSFKEPGECRH